MTPFFLAILLTAFHALIMRIQWVNPNFSSFKRCSFFPRQQCSIPAQPTVHHYSFHLPYHKGWTIFFNGNTILVACPLYVFHSGLTPFSLLTSISMTIAFPLLIQSSGLLSSGQVPTYAWFPFPLTKKLFGPDIGGPLQSVQVVPLAPSCLPVSLTVSFNSWAHWSSDTFRIYTSVSIPSLLHALLPLPLQHCWTLTPPSTIHHTNPPPSSLSSLFRDFFLQVPRSNFFYWPLLIASFFTLSPPFPSFLPPLAFLCSLCYHDSSVFNVRMKITLSESHPQPLWSAACSQSFSPLTLSEPACSPLATSLALAHSSEMSLISSPSQLPDLEQPIHTFKRALSQSYVPGVHQQLAMARAVTPLL